MAKGNNNARSKKPHSSKPYDVSNSFVKKVTSGVSSLLPQSSWLSRWFASSSTTEEDKPSVSSDGDNSGDEHVSQSPPFKRARIPLNRPFPANSFRVSSPIDRGETHPWPSESVASPIPNVFSDSAVPGTSGLSRNPIATSTFHSPNPNPEGLEGKINGDGGSDSSESTSGCSSLAPQRVTPSTSSATHRTVTQKLSNHSQFSLFPTPTHKLSPTINTSLNRRRPSFNVSSFASPNLDSSKLSRESSLNSPFYIGRTMYGGASAYRRPREGVSSESLITSSRRGGVTVRPANEKSQSGSSAEATMSQTARRILEALEQFSSPVSEARRMPQPPQPPLSAKRKRPLDSTSSVKSSIPPAAALNPLTIPMPPERLRLRRLQDATEAARRVARSMSNDSDNYSLRTYDEANLHPRPCKVTKSKPLDEDELPLPVNLPNVPLPITILPTFDLFSPPVQSKSTTRTELPITTSKTMLSDQTSDSAEVENSKKCDSGIAKSNQLEKSSQIDNNGWSTKLVSSNSWECSKCLVRNKTDGEVCEYCGNKRLSSSVASIATSSNVDTTVATTNSGMMPIIFMHVKSSTKMTNFKFSSDNVDSLQTNCVRKSESFPNKLSSSSKPNSKTVSFSNTVSYNLSNPVATSSKIENTNISQNKSNAHPISPFAIRSAPFTNIVTSSASNTIANEFVFSTPTVLPTAKSKETTESKVNSFYFCKPEVLELTKCDSKINREEPNGFHKHSLKSEDSSDIPLVRKSVNKETSEKNNLNTASECDSGIAKSNQLEKSSQIDNNGWSTKFVLPNSWECSNCMVRNKKDVEVCVCCGNKQLSTASKAVSNKDTDGQSRSGSSVPTSGWGSKFQLQPGMWECSSCLVRNKETDLKCVSCSTPRSVDNKPTQQDSQIGSWGSQFKLSSDIWECSTCCVRNKEQDMKCVSCTMPRPGKAVDVKSSRIEPKKSGDDWGQTFKKSSGTWECPVCMIPNKDTVLKCAACEEPKPGFDKNRVGASGSIKFNFEMPPNASSFKFGIDKADTKPPEANIQTFQFGSGKSETSSADQTNFSFGTADTKIPSGFTFGIPQSVPASTSVSGNNATPAKSDVQSTDQVPATSISTFAPSKTSLQSETSKVGGFTFGVTATISTDNAGETNKLNTNKCETDGGASSEKDFKFGVPNASPVGLNSENKNSNIDTAASKSGQSSTSENKNPSFNFGAPTASSKPAAFSFTSNLASSTSTIAAPVATSTFVSPATTTSNSESATTVTSTTSIFSFGSSSSTSVSKPPVSGAPSFSFKGSGTLPASSSIFGAAPQSQFKSPSEGLFSNKTVSTAVPVFGSNSNTSPKSASVQAFGTSATTTTSVPTFSPAPPVFSSKNTSPSATFGTSSAKPIFANASVNFGTVTTTANAPVSTSAITSTSGSISNFVVPTTAGFGVTVTTTGLNVTSPPTFGTTTTSTNFGMPTSTATVVSSNSTPSFGTPAPVAFGTPPTTSSSFGGTSTAPTFSTTASSIFGSSNTPSFGTSTTPGFGSTSVTPNFGGSFGGVTTTPSFGTTAPAVSTVASTPSLPVFGGFSNAAKSAQSLFMFGSTPTTSALGSNFSFNSNAQTVAAQPTATGSPVFGFGSANATNVTSSTVTTPTVAAAAASSATSAQGFGAFSFTPSASPSPSAPGLFGNNAAAVPVFGSTATSTPSAPTFGPGNTSSSTVFRPSFNFGSGGSQQPFSFGSGAQTGSNQPSGNAAFSFGQSLPQPQPQPQAQPQTLQFNPNARPTFNFTGGETPQFTAAAPSTTATPRRVKKAVRRTQRP